MSKSIYFFYLLTVLLTILLNKLPCTAASATTSGKLRFKFSRSRFKSDAILIIFTWLFFAVGLNKTKSLASALYRKTKQTLFLKVNSLKESKIRCGELLPWAPLPCINVCNEIYEIMEFHIFHVAYLCTYSAHLLTLLDVLSCSLQHVQWNTWGYGDSYFVKNCKFGKPLGERLQSDFTPWILTNSYATLFRQFLIVFSQIFKKF